MAVEHKVTVSIDPPKHRPNLSERRRALNAELATKQQDLKREAEQRRAQRAQEAGAQAI
jgi:F0F1-type ATP synthase assembly protein I